MENLKLNLVKEDLYNTMNSVEVKLIFEIENISYFFSKEIFDSKMYCSNFRKEYLDKIYSFIETNKTEILEKVSDLTCTTNRNVVYRTVSPKSFCITLSIGNADLETLKRKIKDFDFMFD